MPKRLNVINRSVAIKRFKIPIVRKSIDEATWAELEPRLFWYGLPELTEYQHSEGGTYSRCRVEVFDSAKDCVGWLPLPSRYADAWIQLCYTVVHCLCEWKAWSEELRRPDDQKKAPRSFIQDCVNNNGTRLLQYLTARRYIAEELLTHPMSKTEKDQLPVFDEFLIRDRMSWLWTTFSDIPRHERRWLRADPVHPGNAEYFGELLVSSGYRSP